VIELGCGKRRSGLTISQRYHGLLPIRNPNNAAKRLNYLKS
jgi:hypothetical protein